MMTACRERGTTIGRQPYEAAMAASYVMKVSANGQVSIPAEARARWAASRVVVAALGAQVVVRPLPADPIGALIGKYRDRGPSSDAARQLARDEDHEDEQRRP